MMGFSGSQITRINCEWQYHLQCMYIKVVPSGLRKVTAVTLLTMENSQKEEFLFCYKTVRNDVF